MTTPLIVSPATRFAVNAPCEDVPVVFSVPADVPFTVRCVLSFARPVTVWLLDSFTTLLLLSRRVAVPLTVTVETTVFVVLSRACCTCPAVVVYFETRVTLSPSRVVAVQVTRPVPLENEHELSSECIGPRPSPRNGPPSPPPM